MHFVGYVVPEISIELCSVPLKFETNMALFI